MKYAFKSFIIASVLIFASHAFADVSFTESQIPDPREVLKLFENPSPGFSPMENQLFTSLLLAQNYPQSKSFEIQRVIRTAIRFYQKEYQAVHGNNWSDEFFGHQNVLDKMHKLRLAMQLNKNIVNTKMYLEYDNYINDLLHIQDENSLGRGFVSSEKPMSQSEILSNEVEGAVEAIIDGYITESKIYSKENGEIKLTMETLPIQKTVGNVSFLASKANRAKAFKVEITKPSEDSGEAIALVTEALLTNDKVSGVLFNNSLLIPSKLDKDSYKMYSYGHRIMLKGVAPLCSRLFR